MKRGLLIIDQAKNTLLVPWNNFELYNITKDNIQFTKQHKTLAELDKDIRKYIKGEYEDEKEVL